MQILIYAGAFVLVITTVIGVHELGHFALAKLSRIRVDEFSIGFGPRLLWRHRGETRYSLRLLPLGGYVRMAGMLGLEGEADAGERNFYRAALPKRFLTIIAGILANFALATACFAVVNMAATVPWGVIPGGPAASAGIPNGAQVVQIDGRSVPDNDATSVAAVLHQATAASQGRTLTVTWHVPNGPSGTNAVQPELVVFNPVAGGSGSAPQGVLVVRRIGTTAVGSGDPAALLGRGATVSIFGYQQRSDGSPGPPFRGTVAKVADGYGSSASQPQAAWLLGVRAGFPGEAPGPALADGFLTIPRFVQSTATGIYDLITQPALGGVNGPNGISGPVGIARDTAQVTQNGFLSQNGLLWWIGFISMNLGLINVLPIPFLDGGKLVFLLLEAVRRKRLDPRIEAAASVVGLAVIVLLLIYVTIGDVGRTT